MKIEDRISGAIKELNELEKAHFVQPSLRLDAYRRKKELQEEIKVLSKALINVISKSQG